MGVVWLMEHAATAMTSHAASPVSNANSSKLKGPRPFSLSDGSPGVSLVFLDVNAPKEGKADMTPLTLQYVTCM